MNIYRLQLWILSLPMVSNIKTVSVSMFHKMCVDATRFAPFTSSNFRFPVTTATPSISGNIFSTSSPPMEIVLVNKLCFQGVQETNTRRHEANSYKSWSLLTASSEHANSKYKLQPARGQQSYHAIEPGFSG